MAISDHFLNSRIAQLNKWKDLSEVELIDAAERAGVPALLLPIHPYAPGKLQTLLLIELQNATTALFPAWLPEAENIEGPGGSGREAVKALALAEAHRSQLFGPYLTALADAALQGHWREYHGEFAPETVIRECHKLFCKAYGAKRAALVLYVADGLSDNAVVEAQQAAHFIADQEAFLIWLTGAGLERFERIPLAPVNRTQQPFVRPSGYEPQAAHISPLAGRPNPLSEIEKRLEAFLCRCHWAAGRAWNASWSDGVLSNPIRVDLLWEAERLVVEIDGMDHLGPEKYARDRARDRALQLAGFRVLRFTNDEAAADIARVASMIEHFLTQARN
jgi:hypothetical protein